jgi:hypothetical protein
MHLLKRITLAGLTGMAAAAIVWAVSPSGGRLKLYTSPPLTINGKTVRLQALMPERWEAEPPSYSSGSRSLTQVGAGRYVLIVGPTQMIRIKPQPEKDWRPSWMRSLFPARDAEDPWISMIYGWSSSDLGVRVYRRPPSSSWPKRFYNVTRGLEEHGGGYMSYYRENEPEFDATYRQIIESFRVIPE